MTHPGVVGRHKWGWNLTRNSATLWKNTKYNNSRGSLSSSGMSPLFINHSFNPHQFQFRQGKLTTKISDLSRTLQCMGIRKLGSSFNTSAKIERMKARNKFHSTGPFLPVGSKAKGSPALCTFSLRKWNNLAAVKFISLYLVGLFVNKQPGVLMHVGLKREE